MKKFFYPFLVCVFLLGSNFLGAQRLISGTFKGTKTQSQLVTLFGNPFIQYGVNYYKITYTSPDAKGVMDTLSGLLAVPTDQSKTYPRLVYQHGTSSCKTCVPSRYGAAGGSEGELGLLFAGIGYISLLPDYVGMGDGRGFQTYVHAATEASAGADMLRASLEWLDQNGISTNEQIFLTGYSQGGHASMALHRLIETDLSNEMTVTAAAHLSGPYSISGVMRDLILNPGVYFYPAYIPNTALGYQEAYGNLYNDITDFFKPVYATPILQYYNGTINLTDLNFRLIQALLSNVGSITPRVMMQDSILVGIETNPNHPINVALRDNDLFNWAPTQPTRIFYCKADDQVPYLNSVIALDSMNALGAVDLAGADVNSTANHSGCVNPALTQTLLFFAGFQQITVDSRDLENSQPVVVSPNPAREDIRITGLNAGTSLRLVDRTGKVVWAQNETLESAVEIPTDGLINGIYLLQMVEANGKTGVKKVAVCR